jgi:5-methylcytosine-specific restriction protein B
MNPLLNQVLYGPPGTGKTYRAMRMAIEICDGMALPDSATDTDVTARFEALRTDGRIALSTFHQSTSYEDFIEGLRPVTKDGTLSYEVKPGLFRQMCEKAQTQVAGNNQTATIDNEPIWKMSLGAIYDRNDSLIFRQCLAGGLLALGYGQELDFTGCDTRDAVWGKLKSAKPDMESSDYNVGSVHAFKNKLAVGDVVVISNGNRRFRAIGRVTGHYQPPLGNHRLAGQESIANWQTRPVEWLWQSLDNEGLSYTEINSKYFSQMSIYEMDSSTINRPAMNALISGGVTGEALNHVIIIDEINRGNVARILGELITCIEPQRRLGAGEQTKVQLTYSQHHFGVPANLYIIGTMNTADRSIAFLDSALRRRFRFLHVRPDPEVVRNAVATIETLDVATVLEGLNRRLAVLLDEDHQLGHAYFLKITSLADLRDVLVDQVIPLLREQFHGDDARWCQALACPFDPDSATQALSTPVLKAETVTLGTGIEPRVRVRINPLFIAAKGEALLPFLRALAV